ncbi:hypothetical protein PHLGIDRAFT_26798 [Phlebiopsis gigantea 11061_1 CR5-6]|uniref:Cytochrome P450 n=1 Tax=Phlebiopsis gigantea (strain 11061_1 CR5-6) TaxID=745531 RepID=A0A0C3S2N9_PHLG1|nr:hypothetical protein PHLGIDRAFT_26798 [Phlebiopsis gigantea 11061_1 CR5-6]
MDALARLNLAPSVGPSAPLFSYIGALKFLFNTRGMLEEGHAKFRMKPFRIATFRYWQYIVASPQHIEELRRAPDEVLSFLEASNDLFSVEYSLGLRDVELEYAVGITRTTLTRHIAALSDTLCDEIRAAFDDIVPVMHEWVPVPALHSMTRIVARTTTRVLVGLPLCRNPEFLDLVISYALHVATTGTLLGMIPLILKPIINPLINTVTALLDKAENLLSPMIEERRKSMEIYGDDWEDKPSDALQWLIEAVRTQVPEERTNRNLSCRILVFGFVSIHTTSMTFTHALYLLAANPHYVHVLREEVETVLNLDGWSKASMQKMRKLDSFLKEILRFYGVTLLFTPRKALQDFTFSDGTLIPKGSYICSANTGTHYEGLNYAEPYEFKPWRFSEMRDETGEGMKHQMTNTSTKYLPFGLGRHSCPGRFFAAHVLKSMMAHLLLTYDITLEQPGKLPKPLSFATLISPNRKAKVLFRKRQC